MAKGKSRSTRRDVVSSSQLPNRTVLTSPAIQLYRPPPTQVAAESLPTRRSSSKPASFSSSSASSTKKTVATAIKLYRGVIGGVTPAHLVCLGRTARKQVLHALGKAGKRGQRKPRFTAKSKVKCS